jgi:hypothetical protein
MLIYNYKTRCWIIKYVFLVLWKMMFVFYKSKLRNIERERERKVYCDQIYKYWKIAPGKCISVNEYLHLVIKNDYTVMWSGLRVLVLYKVQILCTLYIVFKSFILFYFISITCF